MRTMRSDLDSQSSQNRESSEGYAADQRRSVDSDDTACKGVQELAPTGSRKKIWAKKKSPLWVYVSLSIYLSNIQQTVCLFQE